MSTSCRRAADPPHAIDGAGEHHEARVAGALGQARRAYREESAAGRACNE